MLDSILFHTFKSRGEELSLYLYFVYVKVQNLSFLTFFRDSLPSVTFNDLDINFYSRFVTSYDLARTFIESTRQDRHFDI